jgi:AmmeMemoRadiSam system protein B/AmmeMemoRadiSam system protein A
MRSLKYKPIILLIMFIAAACSKDNHDKKNPNPEPIVHLAHLTDGWYPQSEISLQKALQEYFAQAQKYFKFQADPNSVKAIIVPHAGLYYSGLCAASTYQSLLNSDGSKNNHIERVILLAPSHRVFVNGIAFPEYNVYKTALGEIKVDTEVIKILSKASAFTISKETHDKEHSIEIQLPFLQHVLNDFKIVPLIVGNMTDENFALAVNKIQTFVDEKTLVVVSSDFTHQGEFYDYKPFQHDIFVQVRYLDSCAVQIICNGLISDFDKFCRETGISICGSNPIRILMGLKHLGTFGSDISARLACYYMSSQLKQKLFDIVSDEQSENSVSYVGMIFTSQNTEALKAADQLTSYEKKSLLKLVRDKIENEFKPDDKKLPDHVLYPIISPALQKICGAFVTLNTKDGNLRGCIGRIVTDQPLYQTVGEMSVAAAFHDNRFAPVKKEEFDNIVIDITILSKPEKVESYKDIKIGRDGIVLKKFGSDGKLMANAVFLPQVPTNFGWNLQTTLEHLSQKAELGKDGWQNNCEFEVFQGFEIKD